MVMKTNLLLTLVMVMLVSCKGAGSLEKAYTFHEVKTLFVSTTDNSNFKYYSLSAKYELSEKKYWELVKTLNLSKGKNWPVVGLVRIDNEEQKKKWMPGPGESTYQVLSSGFLVSRILSNQTNQSPICYICTIYKDGYMYLNAVGLKADLMKEAQKINGDGDSK